MSIIENTFSGEKSKTTNVNQSKHNYAHEFFFVKSQNSDHQNWSDFLLYKNLLFFDRLVLIFGVNFECQIFSAGRLLNRWVLIVCFYCTGINFIDSRYATTRL